MDTALLIQIPAAFVGVFAALLSVLFFVQLHWPAPALWVLKLYTAALSPVFLLLGVLVALAGVATTSVFISTIGIYNTLIFCLHIFSVTRPPDASCNFEKAFGGNWESQIGSETTRYFLQGRNILKLPQVPAPRIEQNIPFAAIPGTDRRLLCDIWRPQNDISASGLAFIYFHGSAWYLLDKDLGTRPFFRHLAAQGHVIMDVAYRLAPETDMMGMVQDVKRAISWMRENAQSFGVDPNCIVVGGGSARAHLALLAAYTANKPEFSPQELAGKDVSVQAAVSLYGPTDLELMYYHMNQHLTTRSVAGRPSKHAPTQMPSWIIEAMGDNYLRLGLNKMSSNAGTFAAMFGCHPEECPETYVLFSPIAQVHSGCPPTLLIHGGQDAIVPVKTTRALYERLVAVNVPTVMHILPQTDHAFDLQLPIISPSAHNAIYDIERFIALQNAIVKEAGVAARGIAEVRHRV